jgi:hypothetical protein
VGTQEVVGVLLAKIINARHARADHGQLQAIGDRAAHQCALLHGTIEPVEEVAVVAARTLRVQLVDLHAVEDNIDWVCHDTSCHAAKDASRQEVVKAGHAARIRVELVVEVPK